MKISNRRTGFTVVELIVILVVIAAAVLVFNAAQKRSNKATSNTTNQSTPANGVASEVPAVSSVNDLDKVQTLLDQTDPSGSNTADTSQLDSQLSSL